jgi:hypothetical protein
MQPAPVVSPACPYPVHVSPQQTPTHCKWGLKPAALGSPGHQQALSQSCCLMPLLCGVAPLLPQALQRQLEAAQLGAARAEAAAGEQLRAMAAQLTAAQQARAAAEAQAASLRQRAADTGQKVGSMPVCSCVRCGPGACHAGLSNMVQQ